MGAKKKIVKNTLYNFLSSAVSYPLTLVAGIIISRTLAPENYGVWSLCLVYGNLSLRTATAGLIPGCNTLMMKSLATGSVGRQKMFTDIFALEVALIAFGSILSVAAVGLFYDGAYTLAALRIGVAYNAIISMNYMFNYIYQAYGTMKYRLWATVMSLSANLILLLFWTKFLHGVRSLFAMGMALYGTIFLIQFFFVKWRFSLWSWRGIVFRDWIHVIKKSFFFALNSQLLPLFMHFDVLMLSWLSSSREIGFYNISYTYLVIAATISGAIGWAVFPTLSRIQSTACITDSGRYYAPLLKVLLTLGTFISLFFYTFADDFIVLLYGDIYLPSASILKILSISVFFSYVSASFSNFLATGNRENYTALTLGVGVSVNVLLNLILIPKYAGVGAALATVAAEILICIMYAIIFYVKILRLERNLVGHMLACLAMMLILGTAVSLLTLSLFAKIVLFSAGYSLIVWLTGIFPSEVLNQIRTLIHDLGNKGVITNVEAKIEA